MSPTALAVLSPGTGRTGPLTLTHPAGPAVSHGRAAAPPTENA